jgi:hypothetical protein
MCTSRLLNWACSLAAGRTDTVQEAQVENGPRQSTACCIARRDPFEGLLQH